MIRSREIENGYVFCIGFRRTLQSDLKSGTSGNFANLLMALAYGYRDASEVGQSFHGHLAVAGETTESKLLINMLFGLLSHDELIWVSSCRENTAQNIN